MQLYLRLPGKENGVNDYNRLCQRRDREYKVLPLKRARVPAAVAAALPVEKPVTQADIDRILAELHDRRSRELTGRLESFIDAIVGKRLTYAALIAKVGA